MTLLIDGKSCEAAEGQTVLEVARRHGVYIPSLCYHPRTGPAAKCRACVVEIEGMRGMQTACNVPAREGMAVRTDTPALRSAQRLVIDLLLSSGRHDCLACEKNGACELAEAAYRLDIVRPSYELPADEPHDEGTELIAIDPSKCILCGRCIAGCNGTVINEVLGFAHRGRKTRVLCDDGAPMAESTCVQCGECVQLCPTGALHDRKARGKGRPWQLEKVETTCPYCGVGCQMVLHVDRAKNRVVRVTGRESAPNHGMLCVKGRYAYEFHASPKRLTRPLIRRDGVHVPVSWEEALDYTAKRLSEITGRHGPDVFSALGSGRITNENNYAVAKFTRAVMKTNNVDHCARTCHAPTVAGLATAFGSGAATNSVSDILLADVLFVTGSNMTEAHPVVSYYVKQAVKRGARMLIADPRRIDLVRWAHLHAQQRVGTDVAFLNGLIHEILRNGWENAAFMEAHTENPADIRKWVEAYPVERASELCGVPAATMREMARILGTASNVNILYCLGITEHTCGTDNVKALANLQLVLGHLGKPGGGVNPLRGQNNVQGACDMGALPNVYHNYQPVDDPAAREKMEKDWGVDVLPVEPGYRIPTMLHKAHDGGTRALLCVGDNTVQTEPNMAKTVGEIKALEFLVVVDIFQNLTTAHADVILPDVCYNEDDGTYSNLERRVQRLRKAVEPPGEARPCWWIMQELGKRLGVDLRFHSAESVWEDMRRTAPAMKGITWARIEREGLQWPCPTEAHPGTPIMHMGGNFTRGRALFCRTEHRPQAEPPDAEYPFVLSTGRRLWHYHTGTQTRNSIGMETLCPEELLELNPLDAASLGVRTGDWVKARSRRGEISLKAWVTERSPPGVCWCAFHFHEACANELTIDAYDDVTETPEYKACAVCIEKGTPGAPLGTGRLRQARP